MFTTSDIPIIDNPTSTVLNEKKTADEKTTVRAYDMDDCWLADLMKKYGDHLTIRDFIRERKPFLDAEVKAIKTGKFNKVILTLFTMRQSYDIDFRYSETCIPILFYIEQYYKIALGEGIKVMVDISIVADIFAKPTTQLGHSFKRMCQAHYTEAKIETDQHAVQVVDVCKKLLAYSIAHRSYIANKNLHIAFVDDQKLILDTLHAFIDQDNSLFPECSMDFIQYNGTQWKTFGSLVCKGAPDQHYAWTYRYLSLLLLLQHNKIPFKFTDIEDAMTFSETYENFSTKDIINLDISCKINLSLALTTKDLIYVKNFRAEIQKKLKPCLLDPAYITYDELIKEQIITEHGFVSPFTEMEQIDLENKITKCLSESKIEQLKINTVLNENIIFDSLEKSKIFIKLCQDKKSNNNISEDKIILEHPEKLGKYIVSLSKQDTRELLQRTGKNMQELVSQHDGVIERNINYTLTFSNSELLRELLKNARINEQHQKFSTQKVKHGFWGIRTYTALLSIRELRAIDLWLNQNKKISPINNCLIS